MRISTEGGEARETQRRGGGREEFEGHEYWDFRTTAVKEFHKGDSPLTEGIYWVKGGEMR